MSFGAEAAFMASTAGFSPDTRLANGTGQPSMSVPLTWSEANLPIGTLFTARFGDEATLFRLAGQLERARPWWGRRPGVFGQGERVRGGGTGNHILFPDIPRYQTPGSARR